MVTLKDIAKKTGFSVSTVCYSLNNDHRIPEETRHIVQEAASALGYSKKPQAKKLAVYKKFVVFCLNSMNGIIYTELFNTIHRVLHLSNCKVLIYLGSDITSLKWMDGLIVLNPNVKDSDIREVANRKIPVVVMDRVSPINGVSSVYIDNYGGMHALTDYIINKKGAKTFAFVSGPQNSTESSRRFDGFIDCLKENGIEFNETLHYHGDFTTDSGYIIAESSLFHNPLPDAIVCANDEMALGILAAYKDYGLSIGKTLISGFDGSSTRKHAGFITCKCNREHWGSVAAYVLAQMFAKVKSEKTKIPVELAEY